MCVTSDRWYGNRNDGTYHLVRFPNLRQTRWHGTHLCVLSVHCSYFPRLLWSIRYSSSICRNNSCVINYIEILDYLLQQQLCCRNLYKPELDLYVANFMLLNLIVCTFGCKYISNKRSDGLKQIGGRIEADRNAHFVPKRVALTSLSKKTLHLNCLRHMIISHLQAN